MDAQRFDNLARTLASRLSRRNALRRAGAAASASLLAAAGVRADQAAALIQAQNAGQPLFTLIRRYTLNVPTGQVRQALQQGYVADACKAPGFVAYLTVEDETGGFSTIAVFRSQNDLTTFADAEANWVSQNLTNLLPSPDEELTGDTYIHTTAQQDLDICPRSSAASTPTPVNAAQPANTPAQPTNAPAQPTSAPAQPTKAPAPPAPPAPPAAPTPTPVPACTAENCPCDPTVTGACPNGLVCCPGTSSAGPQCTPASACAALPCKGHYCYCPGGVEGACGDGLVCCSSTGTPGGDGACLTEAECNPSCNGQGCGCTGGVQGACDDGFVCCGNGVQISGGPGSCQPVDQCPAPPACTGQGCGCNGGVQGACDDGLICCQDDPSVAGGPGTCQTQDACGQPPCSDNGVACTDSCAADSQCSVCCSGYCNASGVCDGFTPSDTCISDGVNCGGTCNWSDACDACCSGFCDGAGNCNEPGASAGACGDQGCSCELANPACVEGLVCCDDGSGVTGTCLGGC